MIYVDNLSKNFKNTEVLNSLSLEIGTGEIVALLGPNGAGKTTLINCLLGLIPFDKGKIRLFDKYTPGQLQAKKRIGVIPQENSFYPGLTVRENTFFIAKLYQLNNSLFEQRFEELIHLLHFEGKKNSLAENLSGGMKKRLMLLMALIHDPDLIIMDEPTSGVDPALRIEFWSFFHKLSKKNKSILITTHHISEAKDCHKAVFLKQGRVFEQGTPKSLLEKYQTIDLEQAYLLSSQSSKAQQ